MIANRTGSPSAACRSARHRTSSSITPTACHSPSIESIFPERCSPIVHFSSCRYRLLRSIIGSVAGLPPEQSSAFKKSEPLVARDARCRGRRQNHLRRAICSDHQTSWDIARDHLENGDSSRCFDAPDPGRDDGSGRSVHAFVRSRSCPGGVSTTATSSSDIRSRAFTSSRSVGASTTVTFWSVASSEFSSCPPHL